MCLYCLVCDDYVINFLARNCVTWLEINAKAALDVLCKPRLGLTWACNYRRGCGALGAETKLSVSRSLPCCCLLRRSAEVRRGSPASALAASGSSDSRRSSRTAHSYSEASSSALRSSSSSFLVVRKCKSGGISQIADTHLLWIVAGMGLARKEVRGS